MITLDMLEADRITLKVPFTPEVLADVRAHMVDLTGIDKFTCDECGARFRCALVFDAYNTDGDCLAEK